MSTKIHEIPLHKLIKFLELKKDVANEIINRIQEVDTLRDELDDAETKVGDLELSIQDTIDNLKALI